MKTETLAAFRSLLTLKSQWSDYIEDVLELVTVNSGSVVQNQVRESQRTLRPENFPFRICDISLPQG